MEVATSSEASDYSEFVEDLTGAAIIVNRAGDIAAANLEAEALFGYGRGELLGQSVHVLVPGDARGRHSEQVAQYFTAPHGRGPGHGIALSGRRRDGTEFPADILLGPIAEDDATFTIALIHAVEAGSRPAPSSQHLENRMVRLPKVLVERLMALGDGDLSTGIRRMAEMAR